MTTQTTIAIDLGNNESARRGIFPQPDGTFLAMSFSMSKIYKTRAGAEKWMAGAVKRNEFSLANQANQAHKNAQKCTAWSRR